ncbi:MAG: antibiotic biosynthesis monooxygenase [Actinomycetota bacterium]
MPGRRVSPLSVAAFAGARLLISAQPGFRSLSLSRSIESPNNYLLLVEWESMEAHTVGFRTSREYQDWKRLLHPFYDPFPIVEHFVTVIGTAANDVSRR